MVPRISSTTPVILCARSAEILLAMEEDTAEQINVTTVQMIIGIMYPVTSQKAKWDTAPINAVKVITKTLVPTAIFSS